MWRAVRESTCDVRTAIELIFPSPACLFCFSFSRTPLLGIISKWFSDPPPAKNPRFISLIKLNSHFYSGYASCGCEVHCRPFSFLTYTEIVGIEGCIWLRRKSHASCISADKFAKYFGFWTESDEFSTIFNDKDSSIGQLFVCSSMHKIFCDKFDESTFCCFFSDRKSVV